MGREGERICVCISVCACIYVHVWIYINLHTYIKSLSFFPQDLTTVTWGGTFAILKTCSTNNDSKVTPTCLARSSIQYHQLVTVNKYQTVLTSKSFDDLLSKGRIKYNSWSWWSPHTTSLYFSLRKVFHNKIQAVAIAEKGSIQRYSWSINFIKSLVPWKISVLLYSILDPEKIKVSTLRYLQIRFHITFIITSIRMLLITNTKLLLIWMYFFPYEQKKYIRNINFLG